MTEDCFEAELARQAKQGDEQSMRMLFARLSPYVAAVLIGPAMGMLRNAGIDIARNGRRIREAIHSATVDCILSVIESIEEYDPSRAGFRTWVVARGRSVLRPALQVEWPQVRRLSERARQVVLLPTSSGESVEDLALLREQRTELQRRINEVLAELCESQRLALVMYYVVLPSSSSHRERIEEGAALSGCTEDTFEERLKRGRVQFRRRWERRFGSLASTLT